MSETELVFPPFRLDVMHSRLCRDAEWVPIRLKTLAVLRYLIEHRERVVSRDELSQAIWPGRFGTDAAPKQCILELRKLLGDSIRQPRFIQTVGRTGYRFIGALADGSNFMEAPANTAADLPNATLQVSCFGRESALARLQTAWEQAQSGHAQCVLLPGPAGIGKTMVAKAFLQTVATHRYGWTACGQCIEQQGGGEAYLALLDALGTLARGRWRTRLVSILDRHAPLWLLQLPVLIPPGGEAALRQRVQDADPLRMLRELVEALEALTRDEPGILVLEDLQWANPSTLEWLNAWTRRHSAARLLIIATWRTGDGGVKRVGRQLAPGLFNEWRRRPGVTLLPLAELDLPAVEAWLSARFARVEWAARLASALHQRSGGHPLLINALLEQWRARHFLAFSHGEWRLTTDLATLSRSIPITARELIEKRLAGLSFDERQTLEAASVLGAEFSTALIAAILDSDPDLQERRCAALARWGSLLRETGLSLESDGLPATRYAFRYALYQDVIHDQLSAGRRCFLERRARQRLGTAQASSHQTIEAAAHSIH
jgi:predicted ATPase/DNA-binding winged helix-turn-helix (wHTH) protein